MRVFPDSNRKRENSGRNQERSDEDNRFHGQEMKGYHYSTSAGVVPADSLRNEAVKEECLTFIADGLVDDDSPPEILGTGFTLKCHDANGEVYYVTFSRDQVRVSSDSDSTQDHCRDPGGQ